MNKLYGYALLLAAAATLSACDSQADNQVMSNQPAMDANMTAETSMAPMSGPFADAEMRMNEQMMTAVGSDAGQNWVKKMIVHHQGAVDMSRVVLDQNPTADVATMARETITKQGKEIEDLRTLGREGAPDQRSADLYRQAMMDMHQKMMAASGANISETYMRKMLEHHRGAVAMSDVALANGVSGALRSQVQKTRGEQQKEIETVEAMLRGETMAKAKQNATPEPRAAPSSNRQAAPAAPAQTSSAPTRSKASASSASDAATSNQADPHAGHDMNNM